MNIEKLKKCCGYDGKPQQFKYGFDLACRELAKAQAAPEGFVLVPKEIPKSFDEGLYFYSNSISVVNEHSDGFIPMSDIDHSEIWKLVIEAQEPAND